ncbi:MAG: threonine synthase [Bacteroidota bacterium]
MSHLQSTSGESFPLHSLNWRGTDGSLLNILPASSFDPADIKPSSPASLWRYRTAMALPEEVEAVSFQEGFTPLIPIMWAGKEVHLKMDYLFPSGSYKDRGATVLMSWAKHLGVNDVVQDSSGNAGAAIANYATLAGIRARIFVPASTSPAKLVQLKAFGAEINLIPGSREDTAKAAVKAAEGNFYASHVWHPMFFEGTKTFAYEICEQLGWSAPDTVVLPAGNGTLLIGAFLGFQELKQAGVIDRLPKLVGIQAASCSPLFKSFHGYSKGSTSGTMAEGIAIAEPRRGGQMIEIVKQSGGTFLAVEEEEIKESLLAMCLKGYFIEPTSAAVVAGLSQYIRQHAEADEKIVSVLTGNGLKSSDKIQKILSH